jgi:hypothetical protein
VGNSGFATECDEVDGLVDVAVLEITACPAGGGVAAADDRIIRWASHPTKCVDVRAGMAYNGNKIQVWNCGNGENTNVHFMVPSSGEGLIRWTGDQSKCLDVAKGGTWNGNQIILWDCDAAKSNQQWLLPDGSSGLIRWAAHPNKCLDVQRGSTADGNRIILWDCSDGHPNRVFDVSQPQGQGRRLSLRGGTAFPGAFSLLASFWQ